MHLFAWTTFTLQPNSPLLLRETDYCYKTITFHSYILFEFNQFIDTCIIICVYFLFIPFCILFLFWSNLYIYFWRLLLFCNSCMCIISLTLYRENKALMNEQHIRITACIEMWKFYAIKGDLHTSDMLIHILIDIHDVCFWGYLKTNLVRFLLCFFTLLSEIRISFNMAIISWKRTVWLCNG